MMALVSHLAALVSLAWICLCILAAPQSVAQQPAAGPYRDTLRTSEHVRPSGIPLVPGSQAVGSDLSTRGPGVPPPNPFAELGDWWQVDAEGDVIRSHVARLTEDGRLVGRISTIDIQTGQLAPRNGALVLLTQSGLERARAISDENGVFEVPGLDRGVYAFVAAADRGAYAAFSLQILPPVWTGSSQESAQESTENEAASTADVSPSYALDVAAIRPPYRQLETIIIEAARRMWKTRLPVTYPSPSAPQEIWGLQQLIVSDTDPDKTTPASSIRTHPVAMTTDGIVKGRLHGIDAVSGEPKRIRNAMVYILRNGIVLASAGVDEQGSFRIRLPSGGRYALVAVGRDGFAAIAFRAVQVPNGTSDPSAAEELPFYDDESPRAPQPLAIALVELEPILDVPPVMIADVLAGPGGGGHGLGWLGLAGLAGLAGLGGDDPDPPVASPFEP